MKAKSIMIQGTASSVGKSIVCAGLCRVFTQDGKNVAPFKAQNMALNSYITAEGKEMGRAQVVQAEAAGKAASVLMNPILLKPTSGSKSQVIIKGEAYKNMSVDEYHEFKPQLAQMVKEIYDELAVNNEIIVIEGAGSPAEINLKEKDLVNMGMAEMADAPVILVGDIDKGGVFASLAGTMLLFTEKERQRVKGVIINKFRGELEVLKPGIKMLEDIIKVPVLGVLPYADINIDDEDSLSEKLICKRSIDAGDIDIVIIRLPYISNFTDFNALENIPGVSVRYVFSPQEIGRPDLLILPGSKSTMEDMLFLRTSGIEREILNNHKEGTTILGICGGYQMLGAEMVDPEAAESQLLKIDGLGLLNARTVFRVEKTTTQVEGTVCGSVGLMDGLNGTKITGYEIHMGTTEYLEDCHPWVKIEKVLNKQDNYAGGVMNREGNVFGTYIHGIFDNLKFSEGFINNLREKKGKARVTIGDSLDFREFKEKEYDKLADLLRNNLDMQKIYDIIGKN